jgi:hypothetical protein
MLKGVHTVLAILLKLAVPDWVIVVWIFGIGMNVVAMLTLLVAYILVCFFAVILVGGIFCIGAYLVKPVWAVYAKLKFSAPGAAALPPESVPATWFSVGGPDVPDTLARSVITDAGNVPVMPVRVKRSE